MNEPMIPVMIVDDEPLGRELVRHLLAAHKDMQVVGECGDGEKALVAIKRHRPEVVFLDIKMPRLDGMKLLDQLPGEQRPLIVFITAHDTYALRAFDAHAFDYLLKPFDRERFDLALDRVRDRLRQLKAAQLGERVRGLFAPESGPPDSHGSKTFDERIVVRENGRVSFVAAADIAWVEATGNYVTLHVAEGKSHLVHETMAAMEARLDPAKFVRIHRSTIVAIARVRELEPHFNSEFVVVLHDHTRLKLSRTFAAAARRALGLEH